MGHQIVPEVFFFLASIAFGMALELCYDQLRVLRSLFSHSVSLVDAEDILFFAAAGVCFFGMIYLKNEGIPRWFNFAGCGLGALIYRKMVSSLICKAETGLLKVLLYPLSFLIRGIKTGLQKRAKQIKIKKKNRKAARKRKHEQNRKKKTE